MDLFMDRKNSVTFMRK